MDHIRQDARIRGWGVNPILAMPEFWVHNMHCIWTPNPSLIELSWESWELPPDGSSCSISRDREPLNPTTSSKNLNLDLSINLSSDWFEVHGVFELAIVWSSLRMHRGVVAELVSSWAPCGTTRFETLKLSIKAHYESELTGFATLWLCRNYPRLRVAVTMIPTGSVVASDPHVVLRAPTHSTLQTQSALLLLQAHGLMHTMLKRTQSTSKKLIFLPLPNEYWHCNWIPSPMVAQFKYLK